VGRRVTGAAMKRATKRSSSARRIRTGMRIGRRWPHESDKAPLVAENERLAPIHFMLWGDLHGSKLEVPPCSGGVVNRERRCGSRGPRSGLRGGRD
jgi:hypothetical protein